MTNKQVLESFVRQQKAETTNLSTDGVVLLSYNWYQIAKWVEGEAIIRSGASYSRTTAKQRSQLISAFIRARVGYRISSEETPGNERKMLI